MSTPLRTQHPSSGLPLRPQLAPGIGVYRRGDHEVQVGLDPRRAVVVSSLPRRLVTLLRAMDGQVRLAELAERVPAEQVPVLLDLVSGLTERGLIRDGEVRARPEAAVAIRGDGPIAVAVAMLLAQAKVGRVVLESDAVVSEHELGHPFRPADVGRPLRKAVAGILREINPSTVTRTLPSDRSPDLVILADAAVPPPSWVRQLMGERQPHLPVRFRDGAGVVGPLVLPGRTSCLRCADLHRTDRDRHWPMVATQLIGRTQQAGPTSAQATAALAVAQALRVLEPSGQRPPLWNATLELDVNSGETHRRSWHPHPYCDCGAAQPW